MFQRGNEGVQVLLNENKNAQSNTKVSFLTAKT